MRDDYRSYGNYITDYEGFGKRFSFIGCSFVSDPFLWYQPALFACFFVVCVGRGMAEQEK